MTKFCTKHPVCPPIRFSSRFKGSFDEKEEKDDASNNHQPIAVAIFHMRIL